MRLGVVLVQRFLCAAKKNDGAQMFRGNFGSRVLVDQFHFNCVLYMTCMVMCSFNILIIYIMYNEC